MERIMLKPIKDLNYYVLDLETNIKNTGEKAIGSFKGIPWCEDNHIVFCSSRHSSRGFDRAHQRDARGRQPSCHFESCRGEWWLFERAGLWLSQLPKGSTGLFANEGRKADGVWQGDDGSFQVRKKSRKQKKNGVFGDEKKPSGTKKKQKVYNKKFDGKNA